MVLTWLDYEMKCGKQKNNDEEFVNNLVKLIVSVL